MEKIERKERDLILSDGITERTVGDLLKEIVKINRDDDEKEETYREWERRPIRVFINSFGGSVYDGLAAVDMIRQSRTPVYTVCVGSCMSMGLWLWLAGKKRFIGERGTLMFHDISTCVRDKTEGVRQELEESIRLRELFLKDLTDTSDIPEEKLRDVISRKAEWYLSAAEALEYHLADGYYLVDTPFPEKSPKTKIGKEQKV